MRRALLSLLAAAAAVIAAHWFRQQAEVVRLAPGAVPFAAEGRVDRIEDGDTLVADVPGRGRIRIRLHAVDTPELVQSFGSAARQGLAEIVGRRPVALDCYKIDPRGRAVCRVATIHGDGRQIDVGRALVEKGLAWHYRAFASEQTADERRALQAAEAQSRAALRGLWQAAEPMPPWTCRERLRGGEPCD